MHIFLINGGKAFGHSHGRLNQTLHDAAKQWLTEWGHQIEETNIESGYQIEQEVEKFLRADVIIYQMPAWWMGPPWSVKKYLDEVLTAGQGQMYMNDGRSRHDPSRHYGSGGLMQGKRYLLSVTWNAPLEAFDEAGNFFEGKGVEGVYFPFHKSQQFLGLASLPTFIANDVIKVADVERDLTNYRQHLALLFAPQ